MKRYFMMFGLATLVACQKNGATEETAVTMTDVAYGTDARQKMDIYLPAGRNTDSTRVIVMIHGGGWTEGDKADFSGYVNVLKQRLPGYAIFNINYRLAVNGNNTFPAQENDVKKAIEFIYDKKDDYKISGKFALIGASAGAHLALLHAYKNESPVRMSAVVSLFGPSNLVTLYGSNIYIGMALNQVLGATPVSNPALYAASSPINFVDASTPPTLQLQGSVDPLVPPSQATALKAVLDASGVVNQYVLYPGEGHGWTGTALTDTFDKIIGFLQTKANW